MARLLSHQYFYVKLLTMDKEQLEQLERQVQKIEEDLDNLKKIRVFAPPALKKAINGFYLAVETGKNVGCAAWDTKRELESFRENLKSYCDPNDLGCEAAIDRLHQQRAVDFTLDLEKDTGLFKHTLNRILSRFGFAEKEIKGCVIEKD